MDENIKKLKLKYEVKLLKHGYYFIGITNYNDRYIYLEFKNYKGPEKLFGSIIRIWKNLKNKNTEAELKIDVSLEQEYRDYKHLSIKELLKLLNEIEKTGKLPL